MIQQLFKLYLLLCFNPYVVYRISTLYEIFHTRTYVCECPQTHFNIQENNGNFYLLYVQYIIGHTKVESWYILCPK